MAYAGPRIETLDMREEVAGGRRRRSHVAPASFGLHLAAIAALLIVPLLSSNALPEPTTAGVRAFFVEPSGFAPPPPPPPPPAPAASAAKAPVKAVTPPPDPAQFVAPIEVPDEIKPEDTLALGLEGGVPGGVEGGVPGGVVGGIVGGLPAAPPPPPGPVTLRVGGQVKEPRKVKHVDPVYPELAAKARLTGIVILEAIIAPNGTVRDVKVLRGMPMLDVAAMEAVRQWVYSPTLLGGIPVQIALVVTVNFSVTQAVASRG